MRHVQQASCQGDNIFDLFTQGSDFGMSTTAIGRHSAAKEPIAFSPLITYLPSISTVAHWDPTNSMNLHKSITCELLTNPFVYHSSDHTEDLLQILQTLDMGAGLQYWGVMLTLTNLNSW
jgi:hypothetical protein